MLPEPAEMRLSLPKCFLRLPKCALSLSKGCNLRPFDRLRAHPAQAHQVQGASGSGMQREKPLELPCRGVTRNLLDNAHIHLWI